jgi:hypothetical protein
VEVQQVVQLVQGATLLQHLYAPLNLVPGSSKDELVLGLQEALPKLRWLGVRGGDEGLEPATLAALQSGSRLELEEAY